MIGDSHHGGDQQPGVQLGPGDDVGGVFVHRGQLADGSAAGYPGHRHGGFEPPGLLEP